ncbi:hypothetical protein [Chondromyces crocatus]|uniref:PEGA domain-containing protein n=1 Tax=Chondromyces crocatus TaxID=52 RepID=A0A0K1EU75_CHOCO|nr:hypothetical protein [Chondromyces crocatus]AKT44202.1 uncharacterized protein CMC5_084420 [Chondromyces crocatus]
MHQHTPKRPRSLVFLALLSGCALLHAAPAAAEPATRNVESEVLAQTLFEEGRRLMEAQRFPEACPKFQESLQLRPGTGTLLNLALCNEAIGKTATASLQFKEVMFASKRDGHEAREAFAKEHIEALSPKLSWLRVDATPTPGMVIRKNDQALPAAALGTPIPVDPGELVIAASAPGYAAWSVMVKVGEVADRKTVVVPALLPLPEGSSEKGGASSSDAGADASVGRGGLWTAGFVVGAVGVAAVGVGAVFGGLAAGQASRAEDDPALCPAKRCTPAGRGEIDAAETKALVSTIGIGVGVAAVGAGVTMLLLSGRSSQPVGAAYEKARLVPSVGSNGGGLYVLGAF